MRKGRYGVVVAALVGGLALAGFVGAATARLRMRRNLRRRLPRRRLTSTRTAHRPSETKLGKVLSSNGLTLYGLDDGYE